MGWLLVAVLVVLVACFAHMVRTAPDPETPKES